jgi:hypothetical protein
MTLRSLSEVSNFDFFTRSFAGMTLVGRSRRLSPRR